MKESGWERHKGNSFKVDTVLNMNVYEQVAGGLSTERTLSTATLVEASVQELESKAVEKTVEPEKTPARKGLTAKELIKRNIVPRKYVEKPKEPDVKQKSVKDEEAELLKLFSKEISALNDIQDMKDKGEDQSLLGMLIGCPYLTGKSRKETEELLQRYGGSCPITSNSALSDGE